MTRLFKLIRDRWYRSRTGSHRLERFEWEIHNYLTLGEQRDEAESEDLCGRGSDSQIAIFNPSVTGNLTFSANGGNYRVRGLETSVA